MVLPFALCETYQFQNGGNKMKKLAVVIVVFAMILLVSVCGAADKKGYVVKETFQFTLVPNPNASNGLPWGPWGDNNGIGRVYCDKSDFVTGCSYSLQSYPGYTRPWEYSFLHVIPIECNPDLRDEDDGTTVCNGCFVQLSVNHPDPPLNPGSPTDGEFRVYTYCGSRSNK